MNATSHRCLLDPIRIRYLAHRRSLGRQYDHEEWIIASLCRFLATVGAVDLDQALFDSWCSTFAGLNANGRRNRQRIVRNLCLYRRRTEPKCFVPDLSRFARPCPYAAPRIFDPQGIARMLAATHQLRPTPTSPLLPFVMRLAVVLLYTAGLRRGELLRLRLQDIDADSGVLRICESKFHKSRLVPLSGDARLELRAYLRRRSRAPFLTTPSSPLLFNCTRGFHGYTGTGLTRGIHALFAAADVRDRNGRLPRIHDFRHVFALQALLRWYRADLDVQSRLPRLAMYMGHVSIVSTAYYLKWIPEIAEAASTRFESHFGHLIGGEPS
jgi:integrase/recombinase XerD